MSMDIKTYAEQIKQNTKIDFSVFGYEGGMVFGSEACGKDLCYKFEGIFKDEKYCRTVFHIKFGGNHYIGVLQGIGEEQSNYAYLLSELFDNYSQKSFLLSREEFFKAVLLGELDDVKIKRYAKKYGISDKKACVMLIDSDDNAKDVVDVATYYSALDVCFVLKLDNSECALVKYCDNDSGEYRSKTEFAEFLSQSIMEEKCVYTDIFIGGTVEKISDLAASYAQATDTKRMSKALGYERGIHSFKEFMLLHALEELPENKISEFHKMLTDYSDKDIFEDSEMVLTAEAFLQNNLNVSETSRKLYVHRNTLTYRLDKIEKETGLDLRKFSDAVTFRVITLLKSLIK